MGAAIVPRSSGELWTPVVCVIMMAHSMKGRTVVGEVDGSRGDVGAGEIARALADGEMRRLADRGMHGDPVEYHPAMLELGDMAGAGVAARLVEVSVEDWGRVASGGIRNASPEARAIMEDVLENSASRADALDQVRAAFPGYREERPAPPAIGVDASMVAEAIAGRRKADRRPTRVETMDDAHRKAIDLIGRIATIGASSASEASNSEPMRELERMSAGVSTHPLRSVTSAQWERIANDGIEASDPITRNTIGRIVDKAGFNALDDHHARYPETEAKDAGSTRASETRIGTGDLITRRTTAERVASSRAWDLIRDMSKEGVRFFGRPASSPQMEELKGMTRNHTGLEKAIRSVSRSEWRSIAQDRVSSLPELTRLRLGSVAKDAAHTAGRAVVEREVGPSPARSAMPTRGPDYIVGPDAGMSALVAEAAGRGRSR